LRKVCTVGHSWRQIELNQVGDEPENEKNEDNSQKYNKIPHASEPAPSYLEKVDKGIVDAAAVLSDASGHGAHVA
jgi:hypothetical protein